MNAVFSRSVLPKSLGWVVASVAICTPVAAFANNGNNNNSPNANAASGAAGEMQTQQPPSCSIESNLKSVVVSLGPNDRNVSGDGSAGSITVVCNTDKATVTIGSDAMVNSGTINQNDQDRFTNSIDFTARAAGTFTTSTTASGGTINSNPNTPKGNSFGCGDGVGGGGGGGIGFGTNDGVRGTCASGTSSGSLEIVSRNGANTSRIESLSITLDVNAINFETLTKMPIAGDYRGRICISVDPSGLGGQGSGGCSS